MLIYDFPQWRLLCLNTKPKNISKWATSSSKKLVISHQHSVYEEVYTNLDMFVHAYRNYWEHLRVFGDMCMYVAVLDEIFTIKLFEQERWSNKQTSVNVVFRNYFVMAMSNLVYYRIRMQFIKWSIAKA